MGDTNRLHTTATDLTTSLVALADALARAQPDAVAACEPLIARQAAAFRDAAATATTGDRLAPLEAQALAVALRRCRRLGASLEWLVGPRTLPADSPHGYSPVGQPLPPTGEGTFMTARG